MVGSFMVVQRDLRGVALVKINVVDCKLWVLSAFS